jgi:hypothetical protein
MKNIGHAYQAACALTLLLALSLRVRSMLADSLAPAPCTAGADNAVLKFASEVNIDYHSPTEAIPIPSSWVQPAIGASYRPSFFWERRCL